MSPNKAGAKGLVTAPAIAGEGDTRRGGGGGAGLKASPSQVERWRPPLHRHCGSTRPRECASLARLFLEPSVALFVMLRPIAHIVAYAVDLDGEVCFRAKEVEHVRSDRMLAAEDWLTWKTCT